MDRRHFIDIDPIGKLFFDKIFFESYYPILFTCLSSTNNLYLCVCCYADADTKKWLLTEVRPGTIIDLLKNRISIRNAFLKDKGCRLTINYKNGKYKVSVNDLEDWDAEKSINLPTANEYMDSEENEFYAEIRYYSSAEMLFDDVPTEIINFEAIILDKNNSVLINYNDYPNPFNTYMDNNYYRMLFYKAFQDNALVTTKNSFSYSLGQNLIFLDDTAFNKFEFLSDNAMMDLQFLA